MKYRVELRDKDFNVIDILDNEYLDLHWSYSRIGGCGDFGFRLPRKIFEKKVITGEQNIRIYHRNPDTDTYDLWYQGLIDTKVPSVSGNSEQIEIGGHGYQTQLSRIYVSNGAVAQTYVNTEISVIVTDILDSFITPNSDITYDAGDIEATSFTPSSIEFSNDALTCIQQLADLAGTREWGVDKNRNFFFKARSGAVGFTYKFGHKIKNFSETFDFGSIVNKVFVQGAQSGGTYYFAGPYNDIPSQTKYNIRTEILQNSSVTTSDVAQQLADSKITEFKIPVRKASFELIDVQAQIEATNPVPLVNIIKTGARYGQRKFRTGFYSGKVDRIINRINYILSNNNALTIKVDVGQARPSISEELSQLEFNLEQQRSAAL